VINYTSKNSTAVATTVAGDIELKHGVKTVMAQCDITTQEGPGQLIEIAKSKFTKDGSFQIDILINNAGVVNPAPMGSVTHEDFDNTFKLNARAPLFVIQAAMASLPGTERVSSLCAWKTSCLSARSNERLFPSLS
jgi:3-oxoacyl-[acyl-carrier protein] reductase